MKILNFPELRQAYDYDCGAEVMEAVLVYYGIDVREGTLIEMAKTKKWGTPIEGLKKVFKKFKLDYKEGIMNISDLKKYIDKKIPVIIAVQAWSGKKKNDWKKDWKHGHYVVVIGYDKNKIYFEDPASMMRTYLTNNELDERWHDMDTKRKKLEHWGMAVHRSASSKKLKNKLCTDYKKPKKQFEYSLNKFIPMP